MYLCLNRSRVCFFTTNNHKLRSTFFGCKRHLCIDVDDNVLMMERLKNRSEASVLKHYYCADMCLYVRKPTDRVNGSLRLE